MAIDPEHTDLNFLKSIVQDCIDVPNMIQPNPVNNKDLNAIYETSFDFLAELAGYDEGYILVCEKCWNEHLDRFPWIIWHQ